MSELKNDLRINPKELDLEWTMLPEIYGKYSEQVDIAEDSIKKHKMRIELNESELDKKIRSNIEDYSESGKLTETQIKAIIKTDARIIELNEQLLEKELYKKQCMTICNGLSYKKDALKALVTLYTGQLFSVPISDEDGTKFINNQKETSKRNIRKETKRKMRKNRKETK